MTAVNVSRRWGAPPERMRELGVKSAEVRKARWELRRNLRPLTAPAARAAVAKVIEGDDANFTGMRVDELLLMLGKAHAIPLLVAAHVAPYRTVGELSDRQRTLIVDKLRGAAC